MLFFVGLPMFFIEMVLGQYAGISCTKIYARLAPGLRGMGYGMITIPTIVNFQYVVVMAYAVFFMFSSMASKIPWDNCDHGYSTSHCYSLASADNCNGLNNTYFNRTCTDAVDFCSALNHTFDEDVEGFCQRGRIPPLVPIADPDMAFENVTYRVSSSEDYWYRHVLKIAIEDGKVDTTQNSWSKWGAIRWEIVGCLAFSWLLICLSLLQGISSYGKVVYFTTLFPYVILTIILGYVATKEGFANGLEYYLVPRDWSKLYSIKTWNQAAGQIFYSLGVAQGSQLLLSSYNGFKTNAHRDALLIGLCNSLTSLYAGMVVFGGLGYIAQKKNVLIDDVVQSGAGLVFIVFPEVLSLFPVPQLFSVLFFLMLCLLAISSVCGTWEALVASILDEFPQLRKKRMIVMIVTTFLAFLCGLAMCFESGYFLFDMMNNRCSNAVLLLAFIELVTVSWFYGADNILRHVEEMDMIIPRFMKVYWWTCWTIITPAIIAVVTVLQWANAGNDYYLDYTYPAAVTAMGWGLELVAVFIIFVISVVTVIRRSSRGKTWAFIKPGPMMQPNHMWGPRPDSGLPTPAVAKSEDNGGYED